MKFKLVNHISTEGMQPIPAERYNIVKDMHLWIGRLTSYYDDMGQIHWGYGRGVRTVPLYFIQAVDLELFVVLAQESKTPYELFLPYLDSNIKCDVIRCAVPKDKAYKYTNDEAGIRYFLSQHHPDIDVRDRNFTGYLEAEVLNAGAEL